MREHFADREETQSVSTLDVSRNQKTDITPHQRLLSKTQKNTNLHIPKQILILFRYLFRRRRNVKQTRLRRVCSVGLWNAWAFRWLGRNAERFNLGRLTESGNVNNATPKTAIETSKKIQNLHITKKDTLLSVFSDSGDVLLSRAVAHQVSSALRSLTTVFGMGTGVTFLLLPPNVCQTPCGVLTQFCVLKNWIREVSDLLCSSVLYLYGLLHNV